MKTPNDDFIECDTRYFNPFRRIDNFKQRKETFFPNYEKELALFKSMSLEEQQSYLNMSKDEKYAKYGGTLM